MASSSGTVASLVSELDQAIPEHACVAQEIRSQSSEDSAAALLQLRITLQKQVDINGE